MNYNYNQFGQYSYTPQTQYIPLTFVSGIEGAKAFIVTPNQTVYLRDSESDVLYIKSADMQGRYSLKIYNLVPIEQIQKQEYVSVEMFNQFKKEIESKLGGTHE
jgi:hypothetical protein